ncbi:hypothetical protein [Peribacillus kribbensis]|uniref:hypothetical protein n=1 Tax=Peribacillus kribbensis TaxID=356658 RepID=UPI0003F5DEDA|nr:hypothetical protein [Peribacillus kribbensis]
MWDALAFIGLMAFLIFMVLAIISIFKKWGKTKRFFLFAGVAIVLFIVGAINAPTTTDTAQSNVKTEDVEKNTSVKGEDTQTNDEKGNETQEELPTEQTKYTYMAEEMIPSLTDETLELNEKTKSFMTEHYKLFPAKTAADIAQAKKITDSSVSSKHLNKNADPYLNKMTVFTGTVVSIEETKSNDETITLIHAVDNEMQSYQVLLFKPAGDVFEDDRIRFWGVPAGPSSFKNVSGGTTNVQFFVGSHVEKI